jgi:hypothetical protein
MALAATKAKPRAAVKRAGVKRAAVKRAAVKRPKVRRPVAAARARFLDILAQSANVTEAAKKARMTTSAFYQHRRTDAAFRALWQAALCEGYARLETDLLAEALAAPDTEVSDAEIKARLHKQRLALALLAAHRAAVRGEPRIAARPSADKPGRDPREILAEKIAAMRARLDDGPGEAAQ